MKREELEGKTVTELKNIAKDLDIKDISKLKKSNLIE